MNALLIVGSPKGKAGTSYALGRVLFRRLAAAGMEIRETTVSAALATPESRDLLQRDAAAAGLIVFSLPLYVDQLPAPLIRVLGLIAGRDTAAGGTAIGETSVAPRIAAIVQCGFPETHQNQSAVDIMRKFAADAGFRWSGALAMGMGGAVSGRPLDRLRGIQRNTVAALEAAAAALAAGGDIPAEVSALMGKPLMPRALYTFAANYGMKLQARKHKVGRRVYDKPYASE